VVACYEAGRDGHWIYRWLSSVGVEALVIDSSSIERAQGRKHVKTDGVDVERLLDLLIRYCLGLRRSMRVVRVPDERRRRRCGCIGGRAPGQGARPGGELDP